MAAKFVRPLHGDDMSKQGKGQRCAYCRRIMEARGSPGQLAATKDHVIPVWQGGNETVWACRRCNEMKGAMLPDEWSRFMAAHPEWWRHPHLSARLRHRIPRFEHVD